MQLKWLLFTKCSYATNLSCGGVNDDLLLLLLLLVVPEPAIPTESIIQSRITVTAIQPSAIAAPKTTKPVTTVTTIETRVGVRTEATRVEVACTIVTRIELLGCTSDEGEEGDEKDVKVHCCDVCFAA